MNANVIVVGKLKQGGFDIRKRVYSIKGISPTIYTMGGGGCEPKILVYERRKENTHCGVVE